MNKPNKDSTSYIDGSYVKSHPPPEVIVTRKVVKENKETSKK